MNGTWSRRPGQVVTLGDTSPGRSLRGFTGRNYDKGRTKAVQAAWFAVMNLMFVKWWCPASFRPVILRVFGARVGERVLIRHRVRIHWPWKLTVGNDCWIGEDAWLLNLETITIGSDVCLSQGVQLITGSHDMRSETFEYDNSPISIKSHTWIAAGAMVLRGSNVGEGVTISARVVVRGNVSDNTVVRA